MVSCTSRLAQGGLLICALCVAALIAFFIPTGVNADVLVATLSAGARAEYRFDYRGDGSPIKVALDGAAANSVAVWIYTPAQIEAMRRGETLTPIGRGTPNREHDLLWAGGFRVPGVYRVVVENQSAWTVLYRLDISAMA